MEKLFKYRRARGETSGPGVDQCVCLFVCLFHICLVFFVVFKKKKKLVCQVDVFARGCAAPPPFFWDFKAETSSLLAVFVCLFFAISENPRPIS